MTRVAVATFGFLIIWGIFTTVFAASADKTEVRLFPKWLWVVLCLLVPFFGGLLYLMVGRPLPANPGPRGGQSRIIAPDDDPNFLRDIQKFLRKKDQDDKDK